MDKKTLGSFIAVLRKSRGMTQRELAEKLGVSDKTVSHWERDESAPDISVIPVIAEIFDVTCDELLKGEKATDNNEISPQKSHKQIKYLFEKSYLKFRTQCLLCICLALVGFAFSIFAYWAWNWEMILVDFIFTIFSVFGLIISKMQNKMAIFTENFDIELSEKYQKKSKHFFYCSIFVNVILFPITLINFIDGLCFLVSGLAGALFYLILKLTKQITFSHKGKMIERYVCKTVAISSVLIILFAILFSVLPGIIDELNKPDSIRFENMEELKEFMETKKALPEYASGERDIGCVHEVENIDGKYIWRCFDNEKVILEFEWLNNEIQSIQFYSKTNGEGHVADAIFFFEDFSKPVSNIFTIIACIYYPAVVIIPALVCISKIKKKIKNTQK